MSPRVRIRHKDIRQRTPNTPARDSGEERTARGRYYEADCLATDEIGDFVKVSGPPVSGLFQVTKVDITNPADMPTSGIIVEKSSPTRCFVVRFGLVDVSPTVLVPGQKYWVGFDSKLRNTIPTPVTGVAVSQLVGQAFSSTELMLLEGAQPIKLRG